MAHYDGFVEAELRSALADAKQREAKLQQEVEWLRTENAKLSGRLRGHTKPGHGSCCTCQRCGRPYDECRCDLDDTVDELERLQAENAELRNRPAGLSEAAIGVACAYDYARLLDEKGPPHTNRHTDNCDPAE